MKAAAQRFLAKAQNTTWFRTVGVTAWLILGVAGVLALALLLTALVAVVAIPLAVAAVLAALVGIAVENPDYLMVFLSYFVPALLVVMIMLGRIGLLKTCLGAVRAISTSLGKMLGNMSRAIIAKIDEINAQQIVFFTRGDNTANLNNAILYVRRNEHTSRIKIVTVVEDAAHERRRHTEVTARPPGDLGPVLQQEQQHEQV
mgnify:CR=1 FL=1